MLDKKINHGRIKPKKESTFGKVKKPFKGKKRNRKGNTKSSFSDLPVKRLKPKYSSKNDSSLTVEERDFLDYLPTTDYVCFVCGQRNGIEWHHVKEFSTDKKNHFRLIPLCGVEHHRLGTVLSAHGTPKKWRETFSMELQNSFADKIYEKYKEIKL